MYSSPTAVNGPVGGANDMRTPQTLFHCTKLSSPGLSCNSSSDIESAPIGLRAKFSSNLPARTFQSICTFGGRSDLKTIQELFVPLSPPAWNRSSGNSSLEIAATRCHSVVTSESGTTGLTTRV